MSKSFSKQMINVLTARIAEKHSDDTETAINYFTSSATAIDACMTRDEFKEIASRLLKNARIADNKTDKVNYVAVKVLVKIAHVLCAIGQGMRSEIDNHTQIIGFQLAKLQQEGLSNRSAMVAQSKRINYLETDNVQALDNRHRADYAVSTADTQTSSTRMLFNYLGMCDVVKNKKNDVIKIQDNDRARAFIALFAARSE